MDKATVIIQARMGSSRLPGKVLLPLAGKPVLEHVICRCQSVARVDRVIVATTDDPGDLAIVHCVRDLGVGVFRGSQADVLDRYYQTARSFEAKHVVRITADCPLIDPAVIDRVVAAYFQSGVDYATNALEETFPDGQDVEVMSFAALEQAWREATSSADREHVTPYLRRLPGLKRTNVRDDRALGHHRWTLDEPRDMDKISAIFDALYAKDPLFGMEAVLEFLASRPDIDGLNHDISRNEGYLRSLKEERT